MAKRNTQRKTRRNRKGKQNNNNNNRSRNRGSNAIMKPDTSSMVMKLTKESCGMFDPFCQQALGARLPSRGSARSQTACLHGLWNFSASASGPNTVCFDFNNVPQLLIGGATIATGQCTMAIVRTAPNADVTSFFANVAQYRVVSAGVRFHPVLAATSAKPLIFVQTCNDTQSVLGDVISFGSYARDADAALMSLKPFTFISKSIDDRSNEFRPTEVTTPYYNYQPDVYRTGCIFAVDLVTGAPAVGTFEWVVNIEWIPRSETMGGTAYVNQYSAPKVIPGSPEALSIRDKVAQTLPNTYAGVGNIVTKFVDAALMQTAKVAVTRALTWYNPALGAAATVASSKWGAIMNVD